MNDFLHLAGTASAMGDPSRLVMCMSLMDGRAKTAGELARAADVAPSTASEHLARLVDSGLVVVDAHWRHRYYRIASAQVAQMIESLGEVAMLKPSLKHVSPNVPATLRVARTCYDHLAGEVAVAICRELEESRLIECDGTEYRLSARGHDWIADIHLDLGADAGRTRVFAKRCLDWSERRPHVGGLLGAALLRRLVDVRLARSGKGRAMTVSGLRNVLDNLGLKRARTA